MDYMLVHVFVCVCVCVCTCMAGFCTGFFLEGEIIACGNVLTLGGSEGMLPQENFVIYDL